jgi:acetolactate synthase-1/2/3 large subunit
VWLDFPLDVQAAQIDPEAQRGFDAAELADARTENPEHLRATVCAVLSMLREAERPVIIAGNGIRSAGCGRDAVRCRAFEPRNASILVGGQCGVGGRGFRRH